MTNERMRTGEEMHKYIRILMLKHNILWKDIANEHGITHDTLSNIRRGTMPRIDTMYKIAKGLGVTINDIVYIDETE